MTYDYGRKYISKHTGLTGVESKNIAEQLEKSGKDYQSFDWKTIGEDLYGHGKRVSGVKQKLKNMYGVSLETKHMNVKREQDRYSDIEVAMLMPSLMEIHERRSSKSKRMDYSKGARGTFKATDKKGVKKWKKNPNRYDLIGIDDLIK